MRVKMLRNPAAKFKCELKEGEFGDVDQDIGELLIRDGAAVEVSAADEAKEKKEREAADKLLRGVSPAPAIAQAAPVASAPQPAPGEVAQATGHSEPTPAHAEGSVGQAEAKLKAYKDREKDRK